MKKRKNEKPKKKDAHVDDALLTKFQVSLLMAEQGVHTIAYAFPKVNIVSTAVDPEINDK